MSDGAREISWLQDAVLLAPSLSCMRKCEVNLFLYSENVGGRWDKKKMGNAGRLVRLDWDKKEDAHFLFFSFRRLGILEQKARLLSAHIIHLEFFC